MLLHKTLTIYILPQSDRSDLKVYAMLGYTLVAAGVARIGEVLLVLPDLSSLLDTGFAVEDLTRSLPASVNVAKSSASRSKFGQAFLHLPPVVSLSSRRRG